MTILPLCVFWLWPSLLYGQAAVERGLIAHYKFETGDATDSSGNHGRIVGKPKTVGGPSGVALAFDGVQDYLDTQKTLLNRLPEFTVSAFIRSRMLGSRIGIAGQNDVVEVMLFGSACHVWTQNGATWQDLGPANTWFHAAAIGKADRLMLYVNGELKQSVAISRGATFGESQSTAKIAAGVADPSGGYVDDVRFYSRALEPAEIVELSTSDGSNVNTTLAFTSPRAGAIYIDGVYSGRTSADTVTVKGIGAHLIGLAVSGVGYQQQNIYLTGAPRKVVFGEHSWFLPRKWKNLLLGVRNMQLGGGVVAHLSDADLAGARESVRLANEKWVLPFSYGLAEWVMEERVMEAPLGQLGVDQIDGDRFLSEAGFTNLREQYDGIFFFWPVVPDGATTFPCCGAVGGGCCISVPNNWGRVFGWEKPEIWVHEWLHIAEGHFQSQGYYTGIGGLHGAEGHGYRADNSGSWATWYRDFMAGQVREESNFRRYPAPSLGCIITGESRCERRYV